jgi:hypothetical protein
VNIARAHLYAGDLDAAQTEAAKTVDAAGFFAPHKASALGVLAAAKLAKGDLAGALTDARAGKKLAADAGADVWTGTLVRLVEIEALAAMGAKADAGSASGAEDASPAAGTATASGTEEASPEAAQAAAKAQEEAVKAREEARTLARARGRKGPVHRWNTGCIQCQFPGREGGVAHPRAGTDARRLRRSGREHGEETKRESASAGASASAGVDAGRSARRMVEDRRAVGGGDCRRPRALRAPARRAAALSFEERRHGGGDIRRRCGLRDRLRRARRSERRTPWIEGDPDTGVPVGERGRLALRRPHAAAVAG